MEIIPHLVKEIGKSNLKPEQIILICFDQEVIQAFKQVLPQNKAYWLSGFKKDKAGDWRPTLDKVLMTLKDTNADGLDSSKNVPSEIARKVMRAGYEWHAWTVNDVTTAKKPESSRNSIHHHRPTGIDQRFLVKEFPLLR